MGMYTSFSLAAYTLYEWVCTHHSVWRLTRYTNRYVHIIQSGGLHVIQTGMYTSFSLGLTRYTNGYVHIIQSGGLHVIQTGIIMYTSFSLAATRYTNGYVHIIQYGGSIHYHYLIAGLLLFCSQTTSLWLSSVFTYVSFSFSFFMEYNTIMYEYYMTCLLLSLRFTPQKMLTRPK